MHVYDGVERSGRQDEVKKMWSENKEEIVIYAQQHFINFKANGWA